jgi:hypothetical protein
MVGVDASEPRSAWCLELDGRDVAEGLVQARVVEPAEVLDDRQLELVAGAPDPIRDQLGLDRVDEALGQRVVERVADRADRLQHLVVIEHMAELDTGV